MVQYTTREDNSYSNIFKTKKKRPQRNRILSLFTDSYLIYQIHIVDNSKGNRKLFKIHCPGKISVNILTFKRRYFLVHIYKIYHVLPMSFESKQYINTMIRQKT